MTAPYPTIADIGAAARRIASRALRTPLLESPLLNETLGGRLLVKPECLQVTGSFKFRGAFNKISQMDEERRTRGVIAFSSGNHAQGVAAAAHMSGAPAVIVMPEDAPAIKIENTRAWGAEIVTYPRHDADREVIAAEIAEERGLYLVKPYDDNDIIAGQGTTGLEIAQQCDEMGIVPDAVTVCCGGGGLSAGCAIVLKAEFPICDVHTVEPEGWDDTARSLEGGERVRIVDSPPSLCDALLAPTPGEQTFAINKTHVTSGLVVSENDVIDAMAAANRFFKLVAEPGGAVALASVLSGKLEVRQRTVVAVISGGNVDVALYAELLARAS
ncbi:MAG: threonine/serine dehydratase [Rhodospirillales bacterium]|nr:threonine/serine dehydratase [Rhodospirillales bacterium]